MRIGLDDVIGATGARLASGHPGPALAFDSFHTDSREVTPGGLFFALKGASTDGRRFAAHAAQRGAAAVVAESEVEGSPAPVLVVDDPWRAFYQLAAHVLDRIRPLVVGVTGSNGKTSTKELVAAALGARLRVRRTKGNLNTETGVPLTILGLDPQDQALVLEMGLRGPGEIARLARLARPQVGVVTSIGTVHLEFFASQEELARAKGELVAALPEAGLAVLNAEDRYTELLRAMTSARVVTFGLGVGDLRGEDYQPRGDGGALRVQGTEVVIGLPGRHQARNALAALAVAEYAGVPLAEAAPRLAEVAIPGRLRRFPASGGFEIVDDAYNASPESMLAAFETMAEQRPRGRLLAVLGEMRELGSYAEQAHREVGERAGGVFDELAIIDTGLGRLMAAASGAQLVSGLEAAEDWVRSRARGGDLVLIKASHGVGLEALVKRLAG